MTPSFSSSFSFGGSELLLANRLVAADRSEPWTFEVVTGSHAERRPYLIAAGLEQVLALLEGLALAETDLALLRAEPGPGKVDPSLDDAALDRIAGLRFGGDVLAVPEGTVLFAGEPVLRLTAPAPEAVVVGAAVLAILQAQTRVATRAARLRLAAGGKPILELGPDALPRDGALVAARAAHVGGAAASANPLAAGVLGLPSLPIVPISVVTAMGPACGPLSTCGLVLDADGVERIDAALAQVPERPRALLLDVGGMDAATRVLALRTRMNARGWGDVSLIGIGELDEARIDDLARSGIPLDGFGVGTSLLAGAEPASPRFEYELVEREIEGRPEPLVRRDGGRGRRAVWRRRESGRFKGDTVQPESKAPPSGSMPLLVPMMERGKRLFRSPNLSEARVLCEAQLSMLDPAVTRRADPTLYPVNCVVEAAPAPPPRTAATRGGDMRAALGGVFDHLDDSADFTVVSNAFASVVASRLAAEAVEPMADNPEGASAAEASKPPEEAPGDDAAPRSSADEPPEVDLEEIVEEPAPTAELVVVAAADRAAGGTAAPPAPSPAPATASNGTSPPAPAPELPSNPLLAAAARLRSMQSGGVAAASKPPPAPSDSSRPAAAQERVGEKPTGAKPAAEKPAGEKPLDPLLAAAARLKSIRRT